MDTRSKIIRTEQLPHAIALVTGYFDVLRVEHIRALEEVRCGNPQMPLVVLVLQRNGELVSQTSRARVVAALRMVDYVLIAGHRDPDAVLVCLQPAALVRLEEVDLRNNRHLIERVQREQKQ